MILEKVSEYNSRLDDDKVSNLAELRQAFIYRSQRIENDKDFRRFLFFLLYRMEWSEAVLDSVWPKIDELSSLPAKRLSDCLQRLQQGGEIRADIEVADVQKILMCLWEGCLNHYILGRKSMSRLSEMVSKGFDMVMSGIKMEKE